MSAVSQDAVAVPQGERVVYEIDEAWPPTGRRRGWLMRRLLLTADVIGLVISYLIALKLAPPASEVDRVAPAWEAALFFATLPLWVLLARVHGLYDRDEERTDHSTVDDVVGVFQVVTLGTWSFLVITHVFGLPYPNLGRLVVFWLLAVLLIPLLRAVSRAIGRRQARVRPERHHRGVGPRCPPARRQDREALRVRPPRRRVRRPRRPRLRGQRRRHGCRARGDDARSAETCSRARGPPRGDRVLYRLARPDARSDSLDAGQRRPDRHRPPDVRSARNERAAPHDRGDPPRRTAEHAPLRVVAVPEAVAGRFRSDARARAARPDLPASYLY